MYHEYVTEQMDFIYSCALGAFGAILLAIMVTYYYESQPLDSGKEIELKSYL